MNRNDIADIVVQIGKMAEERMEDAETAEEYAFLFGHLNLAACILNAQHRNDGVIKISLTYDSARKAYESSKKKVEEKTTKEETLEGQMDIDDIIPGLLDSLKEIKEILSEQNKTKKHITYAVHSKKKPTNKE